MKRLRKRLSCVHSVVLILIKKDRLKVAEITAELVVWSNKVLAKSIISAPSSLILQGLLSTAFGG